MESLGILQGIAEVAIGLAGFAGIAAGLGYRARGSWSEPDRKRLIAVILFALGAIFACFSPYAIYHLGVDSPWRIASILCVYIPTRGLYSQYKIIRYSPEGYSWSAMWLLVALEVAIILLLLAVALDLGGRYDFGLYLSATLLTLAISSFLFYRLLETSFHNRPKNNNDGGQLDSVEKDQRSNEQANKSSSVKYYTLD